MWGWRFGTGPAPGAGGVAVTARETAWGAPGRCGGRRRARSGSSPLVTGRLPAPGAAGVPASFRRGEGEGGGRNLVSRRAPSAAAFRPL